MKEWKLAPARKIKRQLGSWYLCVLNIKEGRIFNGLPPGKGDATDPADAIVLIDKTEDELVQDRNYEMVFEVFAVPKSDLVFGPGENSLIEVPPIVFPGDIVLAKGQVYKVHTDPVVYACKRDNFIGIIRESSVIYNRDEFFTETTEIDFDSLKDTHGGNPQPIIDVGQGNKAKPVIG